MLLLLGISLKKKNKKKQNKKRKERLKESDEASDDGIEAATLLLSFDRFYTRVTRNNGEWDLRFFFSI